MHVRPLFALPLFALVLAAPARAQGFGPRQVAAPPEDILSGRVRLPEPGAVRTLSSSAALPVAFERAGDGWAFEVEVPVDGGALGSSREASFALIGAGASGWTIELTRPDGRALELAPDLSRELRTGRDAVARRAGRLHGLDTERYDVAEAERGPWRVRVGSDAERPGRGFLVVAGGGELLLASHLTTHERRSDRRIGVAACVLDDDGAAAVPCVGLVTDAVLQVESRFGTLDLPMLDDGEHADGAAGDGLFGAWLPLGLSGPVAAHVVVEGVGDDGGAFLRTTRHAFTVIEPQCVLSGTASTAVLGRRELAIDVGATLLGRPRLQVSAEVWGTSPAGERVPVCWLSRMLEPDPQGPDETTLRLVLDTRWLDRAGAGAPLELCRVRVQDPDVHVPHDRRRRIALAPAPLPPSIGEEPVALAPGLLKSVVAPRPGIERAYGTYVEATGAVAAFRSLLTTHGFCSSDVWGSAGFSAPLLSFVDPNQARTHDEFAQLLLAFGATARSYGIVAHSQGGPAALQLYTYYASGLDGAVGPRRIQSVGAPYQGTPLAAFGFFSCGVVDDLTPEGAALWLAGIPSWARADVYYWTTSNQGIFACNVVSDFFLANPDDGVIEKVRGQLPGANDMGHVLGWCHTLNMSEPAHYTDAVRNAEMDAQAAR